LSDIFLSLCTNKKTVPHKHKSIDSVNKQFGKGNLGFGDAQITQTVYMLLIYARLNQSDASAEIFYHEEDSQLSPFKNSYEGKNIYFSQMREQPVC